MQCNRNSYVNPSKAKRNIYTNFSYQTESERKINQPRETQNIEVYASNATLHKNQVCKNIYAHRCTECTLSYIYICAELNISSERNALNIKINDGSDVILTKCNMHYITYAEL